jgi:hypothetical protein
MTLDTDQIVAIVIIVYVLGVLMGYWIRGYDR